MLQNNPSSGIRYFGNRAIRGYPKRLALVGTLAGPFTLVKQLATAACLAPIAWGGLRRVPIR